MSVSSIPAKPAGCPSKDLNREHKKNAFGKDLRILVLSSRVNNVSQNIPSAALTSCKSAESRGSPSLYEQPLLNWRNLAKDGDELLSILAQLKPLAPSLHGSRVDSEAAELGGYQKIPKEERESNCNVSIDDGKLKVNGHLLDTGVSKMNYVFLKNGTLYVAKAESGKIYHTSLVQDEDEVIAAGEMKVIQGRLIRLNEESGHFAPFDRVGYLAAYLGLKGVSMEKVAIDVSQKRIISEEGRTPSSADRLRRLQQILLQKPQTSSVGLVRSSPPPVRERNRWEEEKSRPRVRSNTFSELSKEGQENIGTSDDFLNPLHIGQWAP